MHDHATSLTLAGLAQPVRNYKTTLASASNDVVILCSQATCILLQCACVERNRCVFVGQVFASKERYREQNQKTSDKEACNAPGCRPHDGITSDRMEEELMNA